MLKQDNADVDVQSSSGGIYDSAARLAEEFAHLDLTRKSDSFVRKSVGATATRTFAIQQVPVSGLLQVDGLTDEGVVFGVALVAGAWRGFHWHPSTGVVLSPVPVVQILSRNSANESVVFLQGGQRAKMKADGTWTQLVLPSGHASSYPENTYIAADGVVCGSVIGSARQDFCVWSTPSSPTVFALPSWLASIGTLWGVSDAGWGCGFGRRASDGHFVPIAVDYRSETVVEIDVTPFSPGSTPEGNALGISSSGRIVGRSPLAWSEGEQMVAFECVSAGGPARRLNTRMNFVTPFDVDNVGNVVGDYQFNGSIDDNRAFFLERGHFWNTFYDLMTASNAAAQGWTKLTEARFMNENKQICGYGRMGTTPAAFLITYE